MNTGVRSASAGNFHRLICDQCESFFEELLYAQTRLLALPAVISGSVVLNAERDANLDTRL